MLDAAADIGPALVRKQRSHLLFVLSNAKAKARPSFVEWYQGSYRRVVQDMAGVLSLQHYEQHPLDITNGRFPSLPFPYLGICELSIDGAQQAESLIEKIARLHEQQPAAQAPATWLYYPASEKVGRSPSASPSMITLAFANATPGQMAEFREWYATRHIRHALQIPALVSGQYFERTQFQRPGALPPNFAAIAMYEQEGTPEDILESLASLPAGSLDFPSLEQDPALFAEWVYRAL